MSSNVSSPYGAPPMDCSTTDVVSSADSACDTEGSNVLVIIAGVGFVAMLAMMPFFLQRRGYCGGLQPVTHTNDDQISNDEKRKNAIDECLVSKVVIHGIPDTLQLMEEGKLNETEESSKMMHTDATSSTVTVEQGQVEECGISTCSTPDTNDTVSLGSFSGDPCHICLETFAMGDEFVVSNMSGCQHGFHRSCILEWLRKHDECPCCRAKFFALKDDTEEEDT